MSRKPRYSPVVRYGNLLGLSLKNVFSLRLQNLLTLITMSVGAFTLSATLFIGDGAMNNLWQELETLMGNWMVVRPDPGAKMKSNFLDPNHFTYQELEKLRSKVQDAKYIEPIYFNRQVLAYKNIRKRVSIDGVGDSIIHEELFQPVLGNKLTEKALKGFSWECYLTDSLYMQLGSPVLESFYVKIGSSRFLVRGVTADPPEADGIFRNRVILPYVAVEQIWGKAGRYGTIAVGWNSMENAEATLLQVRRALDEIRGFGSYSLSSSAFKLRKRKEIVRSFVIFGKTQAFFCIIVASIGILNVMLANVVQKMREFAIRLTLGASRADIFLIVVTESVLYSFIGSMLGVLLSIWFSPDICDLIGGYFEVTKNLTPLVTLQSVGIPLAICSFCGLVAGITPAVRAIRVDILSILRTE